ncbi:MAG: DUF2062 domain-containing protein [Nitrospirota bacterium]|nr:DUF2062 domain-containing protein [Nitrospirota bacterium]
MISLESIRSKALEVLHLQETPKRTALAFAIGVFIAFSPTYGLHTLSALFCAWAFRLNFAALLLGNFVNNPWTTVPILGGTMWTGFLILGIPDTPNFSWDNLTTETLYETVIPFIWPFTVGACTLSVIGALLSYPLALLMVARYRKTHPVGEQVQAT